jgi:hypothetical protein
MTRTAPALTTLSLLFALDCIGCAGHPSAPVVRYADIVRHAAPTGLHFPLVLQFEPGDRIPVELEFESQGFALTPERPALELVAKRRSFVLMDADGLHGSLDGNFDEKVAVPGRFSAGLEVTTAHPRVHIKVVTPRHREPPGG